MTTVAPRRSGENHAKGHSGRSLCRRIVINSTLAISWLLSFILSYWPKLAGDTLECSCVNSVQECPEGGVRTLNVNFTRPEDGVMCVREYNFVESELDVLP